ncbi:hypothetical protein Bca4012_019935 [Brassica carinata]
MDKKISLLIFLFVFSSIIVAVSSQQCDGSGNGSFGGESKYAINRKAILSSLPANVKMPEGFYNGWTDDGPESSDRVYAMAMCIDGSGPEVCSECLKVATDLLIHNCHNESEGFIWFPYKTLCFARFSNRSFSGGHDTHLLYSEHSSGFSRLGPTGFDQKFSNLARPCLEESVVYHKVENLIHRQGGVIAYPSCFFRWELYPLEVPINSLQYDLKTIEAATCTFSKRNMLGEGGFGEVYKGNWRPPWGRRFFTSGKLGNYRTFSARRPDLCNHHQPGSGEGVSSQQCNVHGDAIKPTCSGDAFGPFSQQRDVHGDVLKPTCSGDAFRPFSQQRDVHGDALKPTCSGDTFGPSSQQCDVYGDDLKSPAVVTTSGHQASNAMTSLQLTN